MRGAVERVVRKQAEHEGTPHMGVVLAQMRDPVAEHLELPRDPAAVQRARQVHALGGARSPHAEEIGIWPLVCQEKRKAFLVGTDDAGGKPVDAFLAKQVMRDQGGHMIPFQVALSGFIMPLARGFKTTRRLPVFDIMAVAVRCCR